MKLRDKRRQRTAARREMRREDFLDEAVPASESGYRRHVSEEEVPVLGKGIVRAHSLPERGACGSGRPTASSLYQPLFSEPDEFAGLEDDGRGQRIVEASRDRRDAKRNRRGVRRSNWENEAMSEIHAARDGDEDFLARLDEALCNGSRSERSASDVNIQFHEDYDDDTGSIAARQLLADLHNDDFDERMELEAIASGASEPEAWEARALRESNASLGNALLDTRGNRAEPSFFMDRPLSRDLTAESLRNDLMSIMEPQPESLHVVRRAFSFKGKTYDVGESVKGHWNGAGLQVTAENGETMVVPPSYIQVSDRMAARAEAHAHARQQRERREAGRRTDDIPSGRLFEQERHATQRRASHLPDGRRLIDIR